MANNSRHFIGYLVMVPKNAIDGVHQYNPLYLLRESGDPHDSYCVYL